MNSEIEPFVPRDVDLRDFRFLPLDVVRLRDSNFAAAATGEEFKAAVLLWCAAWHQIPPGSLPDNEKWLAHHSGAGTEWPQVRQEALHGFVRCTDGRLYHPVIAEKALEAWKKKVNQRNRGQAGAHARWGDKKSLLDASSIREAMLADAKGQGQGSKTSGDLQSPVDLCPHQKIIDLYLECMPTNPRVQKSRWQGSKSETNLRKRWREGLNANEGPFHFDTVEAGLAAFRIFFETCAQSDFLCGRAATPPGRTPFLADLHWLLERTNFDKVLSNRYHREAA